MIRIGFFGGERERAFTEPNIGLTRLLARSCFCAVLLCVGDFAVKSTPSFLDSRTSN